MAAEKKNVDMIVNLYNLPDSQRVYDACAEREIIVRKARAYEKHIVSAWVETHFTASWASEVEVAFARLPIGCFVATQHKQLLGFACIESTARGFYGPTGVLESARGQNIGTVLLLRCMEALRELGYAYGIIGGAGPRAFYEKAVGARVIENCHVKTTGETSVYQDMLL